MSALANAVEAILGPVCSPDEAERRIAAAHQRLAARGRPTGTAPIVESVAPMDGPRTVSARDGAPCLMGPCPVCHAPKGARCTTPGETHEARRRRL